MKTFLYSRGSLHLITGPLMVSDRCSNVQAIRLIHTRNNTIDNILLQYIELINIKTMCVLKVCIGHWGARYQPSWAQSIIDDTAQPSCVPIYIFFTHQNIFCIHASKSRDTKRLFFIFLRLNLRSSHCIFLAISPLARHSRARPSTSVWWSTICMVQLHMNFCESTSGIHTGGKIEPHLLL